MLPLPGNDTTDRDERVEAGAHPAYDRMRASENGPSIDVFGPVKFDPDWHHRRSIRLRGYDYTQVGAYFVTIRINGGGCLLGEVVDGVMYPGAAGKMVQTVWEEIPGRYPGVDVDAFVVMPNRVHGVIVLHSVGATPRGRPEPGQAQGPAPTMSTMSLPDVVHRFKSLTTSKYSGGVREGSGPPFERRLWQRNYYEHVIRNDDELDRIRQYIVGNPVKWEQDEENPRNL